MNTKKKTNKKFLIPIIAIFGLAGVLAVGYIVSNLVLTVGVAEPFIVEYNILGDAGTYTEGTCAETTEGWFVATDTNIPTGTMFAGESRRVCVKVTNQAEAEISYVVSNTVVSLSGNETKTQYCREAFGEESIPKTVNAKVGELAGLDYTGKTIVVSDGATPVDDCVVTISVTRV
jgi:hypothetical protein